MLILFLEIFEFCSKRNREILAIVKVIEFHVTNSTIDSSKIRRIAYSSFDLRCLGLRLAVNASQANLAELNRLFASRCRKAEITLRRRKDLDLLPDKDMQVV